MFIRRPLREDSIELDEGKQEPLTLFSEFPRCSIVWIVCRARVRMIAPRPPVNKVPRPGPFVPSLPDCVQPGPYSWSFNLNYY
ncbi:hypothetical protein N7527_011033 [Penicillium freii]|nr:hypothetical protein N7527_011033 [Penicillium freii]